MKSRMANIEDITVSLMNERCIFCFILADLAPKCVLDIVKVQRHMAKGIRDV